MATLLEKLQSLIDPKLEELFSRKAYDPSKDRAWLVKRLESAKTQFSATETTRGGGAKWWKLANGVVAFSPVRKDGQPLQINGASTVFVPSERFANFIDAMIAAVQAGEFDPQLEGSTPAGSSVAMDTKPARARKPRSDAGSGWGPERRKKYEETLAKRRAAKEAAARADA